MVQKLMPVDSPRVVLAEEEREEKRHSPTDDMDEGFRRARIGKMVLFHKME